jgi:cobalt transporter subunit CbtA
MFRRIFLTALIAGAVAGLFDAGVQRLRIVPLIQQAEIYEAAGEAHHGHDHAEAPGAAAWEPEPGLERTFYTVLADVLTGIGLGLLLTGAVALASLGGHVVDARRGLLWGAAGFAAFTLAPSLGLPPGLPGMAAAELAERQVWWIGTATATAIGIAFIVFRSAPLYRALGAALIALPHIVGAPHPPEHGGSVPPELAAQFVLASIVTAAAFWLVLGSVSGWLYRRLAP